jgi:hypothetical protein
MPKVTRPQGLRRGRSVAALIIPLFGWMWPSFAFGSPAAPTPTALRPAATPITEVRGTIPATLAGSWLAVFNTETRTGLVSNWQVYRIVREDQAWHVQRYDRIDVPAFRQEIDAARQKHEAFTPSPAAIKAVGRALPHMKLLPEAQAFRHVVLSVGPLATAGATPPPQAQGAKLSISMLEKTKGPTISTLSLYAKEVRHDTVTGDTAVAMLAPSGLSVAPLDLAGRFTMYRLQLEGE